MTRRVLTIFNCGTAFDRESKGETTAALFEDATGFELSTWDGDVATARRYSQFKLINDGPGSIARLRSNRAIKGVVLAAAAFPLELGLGSGMKEMMEQSVAMIQKLHAAAPLDRINLTGWSRGGIMCIYLANVLWRDPALKDIPIGIVANDPVAGTANNFWGDFYQIPPNVDVFCAFVMLNENLKMLEAVKPHKMSKRLNKQVIIMPGTHPDGVLDRKNLYGRAMFDVEIRQTPSTERVDRWNRLFPVYDGLVSVHVIVDFLTGWALTAMGSLIPEDHSHALDSSARKELGTEFNPTRTSDIDKLYKSRAEQLRIYSLMVLDAQKLHDRGPNTRYKLNGVQQYAAIRSYLVIGAGYYINELHEHMFKRDYPSIHAQFLASEAAAERLEALMDALGVSAPASGVTGMLYKLWSSSKAASERISLQRLEPALAKVGAQVTAGEFSQMYKNAIEVYDSLTRFRYWVAAAKASADSSFDGQRSKYTGKFSAYAWGSFHKTPETAKHFVPWT